MIGERQIAIERRKALLFPVRGSARNQPWRAPRCRLKPDFAKTFRTNALTSERFARDIDL